MKSELSETLENLVAELMEELHLSKPDACQCLAMALADDRIIQFMRESVQAYLDSFTSAGGQ
jgi:hypothetical protein